MADESEGDLVVQLPNEMSFSAKMALTDAANLRTDVNAATQATQTNGAAIQVRDKIKKKSVIIMITIIII